MEEERSLALTMTQLVHVTDTYGYGTLTTFEVPGSGTARFQGTFPRGIDAGGLIVGDEIDSNSVSHGFVRYPSGNVVTFNAPGAGTGFFQGTFVVTPNSGGRIAGQYVDSNDVSHGLLVSFP